MALTPDLVEGLAGLDDERLAEVLEQLDRRRGRARPFPLHQLHRAIEGSSLSPTQRLVGLVLGKCAGPEGLAWPKLETLQARTGLSDRAIQQALRALVAAGWLEDRGPHPVWRTTVYAVTRTHWAPNEVRPERGSPPPRRRFGGTPKEVRGDPEGGSPRSCQGSFQGSDQGGGAPPPPPGPTIEQLAEGTDLGAAVARALLRWADGGLYEPDAWARARARGGDLVAAQLGLHRELERRCSVLRPAATPAEVDQAVDLWPGVRYPRPWELARLVVQARQEEARQAAAAQLDLPEPLPTDDLVVVPEFGRGLVPRQLAVEQGYRFEEVEV